MEAGPPSQSPGFGGIVAVLAAGAAAVLIFAFGGRLTTAGDPDPSVPSIPVTLPPDPASDAIEIVNRFAIALGADDSDAALSLMSDEVVAADVPGFPLPDFVSSDRVTVIEAVGVLAVIADLDPGICTAHPPVNGADVDLVVDCPDGSFGGPLPEVLAEPRVGGVWFSIRDGRIVAFGDHSSYTPFKPAFCVWAESAGYIGPFDLNCNVRFGVDHAAALDRAAAAWLAAGRPTLGDTRERMPARLSLAVVGRFLGGLDGDRTTAALMVHPDLVPADTVGHLGGEGPPPTPTGFVRWFGAAYTLDVPPGACGPVAGAPDAVRCAEVRWGGPLIDAIGLDPAASTLRFEVRDGLISAIEGSAPAGVATWFRVFCGWMRTERPSVAPYALMGDCVPVYTGFGGDALAQMAEVYADRRR